MHDPNLQLNPTQPFPPHYSVTTWKPISVIQEIETNIFYFIIILERRAGKAMIKYIYSKYHLNY